MPAARVEYIAPWWVVWLHSVPHLGLRLQPVDSTFRPRDESYQEVSPRPDAPSPRTAPSRLSARRAPRASRPHTPPTPHSPRSLFPLRPFPRESLAHGPPVWEPHGPGKLERWELSRPTARGEGRFLRCGGRG